MTDIPGLLNLAQDLARHGRSTRRRPRRARPSPSIRTAPRPPLVGSLLRVAGRMAAAEAAYGEALRLQPGFPSALFGLAKLLRDTGRLAEARLSSSRCCARARPCRSSCSAG